MSWAEGIRALPGFFLYAMLAAGLLLLMWERFLLWQRSLWLKRRLSLDRREEKAARPLQEHLEMLLQVTLGRRIPSYVYLLVTLLLFLTMFLAALQALAPLPALAAAGMAAAAPYLLLRIRLESLRRKNSLEGEALVSELLRQYRISGFNIYETLERAVQEGKGLKHSRRLLYRLLLKLRSTANPVSIRSAVEEFAYAVDTNWSRMLAHNIRMAAEKGVNVSLSVEDVLIQLREARTLWEERKRLNGEANRMVLFLVPFMYLLTVFLSTRYLEVPLGRFLSNQFAEPEGLMFFFLIFFLFVANLAIMEAVKGQRFDY
ncbi:MAG: hypothetical protein Q4C22_05845 [Bacillota bacterium]|nr:hypothetical protein [Bacillota bacterium]